MTSLLFVYETSLPAAQRVFDSKSRRQAGPWTSLNQNNNNAGRGEVLRLRGYLLVFLLLLSLSYIVKSSPCGLLPSRSRNFLAHVNTSLNCGIDFDIQKNYVTCTVIGGQEALLFTKARS